MFTPVVAENRLYVATHSKASKGAVGKVYAMDTHTGRRLWEQGLQGGAAQEAMLFEDLVLVGGGNWTYAFAAADGKEVWNHFDSERKVSETGFVLGSTVYFICGNEVLALNARSGAKVWAASLKGIEGRSVIIGEGDRIFFIENRFLGRSYAIGLDAKTGLKVWEQKLNMSSTDFSGPCWAQDGVVLLNMGNELLALDLADGKERWRMTTEEKMPSFPTPLGPLVLIATTKKKESTIQALGFIDGKTAWTYKISEKAGAGPVLGAKDCLLFQTKAEAVIGLR